MRGDQEEINYLFTQATIVWSLISSEISSFHLDSTGTRMSCAQRFKKKLGTKFQLPWKLSDCFPIWRTNMTFSLFRRKKTRKRDLNLGIHTPPFFSFASRVVTLNFVYFFLVSTEWIVVLLSP